MSENHSPDLESTDSSDNHSTPSGSIESNSSKELDVKEIVKDDIDDIEIDPEGTEQLTKLISYIHGLPLEKKNQLLANLAKNRDVNPNGNVYYPTAKKDILKFKMQQIIAQKRNQRLGNNAIKHKMEMAKAYRKNKETSTTSPEDPEVDNTSTEDNGTNESMETTNETVDEVGSDEDKKEDE